MNRLLATTASLLAIAAITLHAGPAPSPGAEKWLDWTNPNIGAGVNIYANAGTHAVNDSGAKRFGPDINDITFTSNNEQPVAEHQLGNALWGQGGRASLFDPDALAGKAGIELLVEVDAESTSSKLCIKLLTADESDPYMQTLDIEKGTPQLVKFPLAEFKNKAGEPLDPTDLKGVIQISDGWAGYPSPKQAVWKARLSDLYTYGE